MLATTWPWAVVGAIVGVATSINVSLGHPAIAMLVWVPICGAVGASQQRLLQRYGQSMRWWTLATIIGGVLAMGGCLTIYPLFILFLPIIVGTAVSIAQWLVLRDRCQARTALWIPLNFGVGILGNFLLFLLYRMMFFSPSGSQLEFLMALTLMIILGGILVSGMSSFFTALVLYRWMMSPNIVEADMIGND